MRGLSNEDLLKEHEALSRKVEELSGKLYRVNNKLKESEALKGHFISNITNEIINPFSSILVIAENMQKLKNGQMDEAKMMSSMIYDEAFHLDFQLKNIFAAAAIEAGKDDLKPTTVNLNSLFEKSILFFKKQINSKEISINLKQEQKNEGDYTFFVTDEDKLALIIKNLLDNAIKFSFEKGQIDISMLLDENGLTFSVRDYGKGIPTEKTQAIFDRFLQLDERINSINSGHGLGLSIVNSYVLYLNGYLEIEEQNGAGVCMKVSISELEKDEVWDELDQFIIDPDEKF